MYQIKKKKKFKKMLENSPVFESMRDVLGS